MKAFQERCAEVLHIQEDLNEADGTNKRKRDFAHALCGMDRAVQWIRQHQDVLSGFTLHLYPDREFRVEVNLSFIEGGRLDEARKLFAGRSVKKITRDEEETYELVDEDLQIRFKWAIWKFLAEPRKVIEESIVF